MNREREEIEKSFNRAKQKETNPTDARDSLFAALRGEISVFKDKNHHSINKGTNLVHYTSLETIYSIIEEYKPITKKPITKEHKPSYLRLYDADYVNDPSEGTWLKERLQEEEEHKWLKQEECKYFKNAPQVYTEVFICSFISGKKDDDIGDKLAYWQSYGNDGLGCSIQIHIGDDDYKHFMPVVYEGDKEFDEKFNKIKSKTERYFCLASTLYNEYDSDEEKKKFLEEFWKCFDDIRFLYKDDAYKDEKECRCVKIIRELDKPSLYNPSPIEIKYELKREGQYLRRYIEDNRLKTKHILSSGSNIIVGPAIRKANHLCKNLEKFARKKQLWGPEFDKSIIPYQKFW